MPQVRFEATIPVYERARTVLVLDCAATVMGSCKHTVYIEIRRKFHLNVSNLFSFYKYYIFWTLSIALFSFKNIKRFGE
jgi:hypothetical protein